MAENNHTGSFTSAETLLQTQIQTSVVSADDGFLAIITGSFEPDASGSTAVLTASMTPTDGRFSATTVDATVNSVSVPSISSESSIATAARATSTPSGPSPSMKIGLGLGIPLGFLIVAIVACAIYFFRKRDKEARHPPVKKSASPGYGVFHNEGTMDDLEQHEEVDKRNSSLPEKDGINIVPYSRELPGSPGVRRHELPAREAPP